jgi:hypothetical protein
MHQMKSSRRMTSGAPLIDDELGARTENATERNFLQRRYQALTRA